jgi:type II secretory pathway pseudopilin PulG
MIIRPNKKFDFTLPMPCERSTLRSRRAIALSEGGFTLVELLIAAAITVIIVVLLGLMLSSLMSSAARASQRVDAFRDARAALQMMERDLSNVVRTQWNPDPFASPTPLPCAPSATTTNPVTRPAAYFAAANIWQDANDPYSNSNPNAQIFALISTKSGGSPTPTSGDVCAVGYYCSWDPQLHAYTLRRFFRDSTATFTALKNVVSYASNSDLYVPSPGDDVLAAYVWNLNITPYDAAGKSYTTYPCICDQSATTPALLPAAIEISFNAMSPKAARTVMSISNISAADWMNAVMMPIPSPTPNYQGLILPHTYQFRTRINFQ